MSRSDMPFATDDHLIAELRDARPEAPADLLDPHAPANEAILQAVLAASDQPVRRRRAPARVAVAAAAAAAITAGVVVAGPYGRSEPSAADVVRKAAAVSESALDSGGAEVTVWSEQTGHLLSVDEPDRTNSSVAVYSYRFDGDDVAVQMELDDDGYRSESRIVDGEMYWHPGPDPASPWFHSADHDGFRSDWTDGDPRTLLDILEPRAGFALVGDDDVDGVAVTHLRSTTPSNLEADELGLAQVLATSLEAPLTRLEVWVDADGVVRQIDIGVTERVELPVAASDGSTVTSEVTFTTSATVRFVDIGVPNTVEAPPTFCEVTDEDMSNPPPPGAPIPGC